jgi:hypothetical protein
MMTGGTESTRAIASLGPKIERADNPCVEQAGELSNEALRAYRELAIAAQEGDADAAGVAAEEGYDLELRAVEQLRSCPAGG